MNDTETTTERLRARMAYLGARGRAPTADLLPTRSMPPSLTVPECRHVAAYLVSLVRCTYARRRKEHRALETGRPDDYGDGPLARWDGGYDWRGYYEPPTWARIAGAALGRGFDVEDFVEKAFVVAAGSGTPYPNKLLTPAAMEDYDRTQMGTVVHLLRVRRDVDADQFARGIVRERSLFGAGAERAAAVAVLRDPTSQVRPFYRYWVASRFVHEEPGLQEIRWRYRLPALRQYASSVRAYDAAYGGEVPGDLRAIVAMAGRALAELVARDQARWVPAPAEAPPPGRTGA